MTYTPSDATTRTLTPGESFSVAGSWQAAYTGAGCAGCATSIYLAGLAPYLGQLNVAELPFRAGLTAVSGTYAGLFTAPTSAGTYCIGAAWLWDAFQPGQVGSANATDQVSCIINVDSPPPRACRSHPARA